MISASRFRSIIPHGLFAFLAAALLLAAPGTRLGAQVRAVYSRGAAGVLQQIQKLGTTASVLLVGAHPDDEDSAFIARSARGDHARTAYLSLNRGEGGQNAIGPELFDALGVIRTEELLQARTLDGGGQFFTRAFDFGFSKTLAETRRMWGERDVLADVVRIIRTYRPLVVYSIFSGTPADGHGHHQYAGVITPEAFRAAADPAQFLEQIAEGLRPWQALKLYRAAAFGQAGPEEGAGATAIIETGQLDPLLGRSYAEIAAEGRDQHKSQKMGGPELRGARESGLILVDAKVKTLAREHSVFDGIDTSITGLPSLAGLPEGSLKGQLSDLDRAVSAAVAGFNALEPEKSVSNLADALTAIRAARSALKGIRDASADARAEADFMLGIKEHDAVQALRLASGTVVDAVSTRETLNGGQTFEVDVRSFLAHPSLVKITGAALKAPEGWKMEATGIASPMMNETADRTDAFNVTVPEEAPPTQPYWLTQPRTGWLYSWPPAGPRGVPFASPLVSVEVEAEIGGVPVTLDQPVQYRLIDPVRGELRRNVEVVPAVSVAVDPQLLMVPLESLGRPMRVSVRLQSNSSVETSGTARLEAPPGWTVTPSQAPFTLRREGENTALAFTVTPGRGVAAGRSTLKATVRSGSRTFELSMRTISYPHIQTHRIYTPAEADVRVLDLKVLPVRVGYIMGSGDQVPDALRRMGFDVTLLGNDDLAAGDLSRFGTIVVGIRATEARPGFVAANGRLLDYVRRGGTLIVQYQQNSYAENKLTPLAASMASRVTDETAAVRILAPRHPALTTPNRIGDQDFDGWVQERNLYAFTTFDPGYTPLLESHDPGEPPQNGGEVYARIGKGQYVYTSYAWFRQLPAGVPGAWRMFANLVCLGSTSSASR